VIRIRRIFDDILPRDVQVIKDVQDILRAQFPLLSEGTIKKLPEQLRNPLKYRFRSILFVAEGVSGQIKGFALLQHAPDLRFSYLDFISAAEHRTGGGIGSVLYERVREEALSLNNIGLFFECLPDDPSLCKDPEILKQNAARLRFYERYGARPVINTAYETSLNDRDDCPPYLVYDNLGKIRILFRNQTRKIVHAILERKYGDLCPTEYIDMVVGSFKDNPVKIREPKYIKKDISVDVKPIRSLEKLIVMTVSDKHEIHHVHERGYVESPVRISSILKKLELSGLFERTKLRHFNERHIRAVHENKFIDYFKKVCAIVEPNKSVYPYIFPIRNNTRPPKELPIRAGYYCIDTFTPINENAFLAAKRAVDCALTVTQKVLGEGSRLGYALVRPPGHHAEYKAFGGFCYLNSAAIAAHYASAFGRVAVLDLDFHHGNGTQNIFYKRSDVVTISIHGDPSFAYPYFSGFGDETGEGEGAGYNKNYPLPEKIDPGQHREVLAKALRRIMRLKCIILIVPLGFDTAKGDPTGTWDLLPKDFLAMGRMIGSLRLPTIVIQEGGYRIRSLGTNAYNFFLGLWEKALTHS
jgi:acetoin utilization deacetylase AcuC-like enzyme/GNAT superfamily N-acetyltransferase